MFLGAFRNFSLKPNIPNFYWVVNLSETGVHPSFIHPSILPSIFNGHFLRRSGSLGSAGASSICHRAVEWCSLRGCRGAINHRTHTHLRLLKWPSMHIFKIMELIRVPIILIKAITIDGKVLSNLMMISLLLI